MERQGNVQESVRVESYKRSQAGHNAPSSDESGRWQQPPPRAAVTMYRSMADSVYHPTSTGGCYHSSLYAAGKPRHSSGHTETAIRQPADRSCIQSSGRRLRGHSPVNSSQSHVGRGTCIVQQQAIEHARAQASSIQAGDSGVASLPTQFSRTVAGNNRSSSSRHITPDESRQLRPTPPAPLTEHRSSLPGSSSRTPRHPSADPRAPTHSSLTATASHVAQIPATHGTKSQYLARENRSASTRVLSGRSPAGQSRSSSTSRPVHRSTSQIRQPAHAATTRFVNHSSHTSASLSHPEHSRTPPPPADATTSSSVMSTMSVGSSMSTTPAAMSTHRGAMFPHDTPRHDHRRVISDACGSGSVIMDTLSESSSSAFMQQQQQQHSYSQQMQNSMPLTRTNPSHSVQHAQQSAPLARYPSAQSAITTQLPAQPALARLQSNMIKLPRLQDVVKEGYGVVGLRNLGNTCFMNSMLQCLAAVPDLLRFVVSKGFIQEKKGSYLTAEYKTLVRMLWSVGPSHSVAPSGFLSKMQRVHEKWGARAQQDSHEFLLALLDRLQTEGDRNLRTPQYRELVGKGSVAEQAATAAEYAREWSDSWVDDTFGGLLQSTVECQRCGDKSFRFDTCLDVSVPLPSARECNAKWGAEGVPLDICLRKFIEPEVLDVEYKCEGCGHVTSRRKWLQMFTPPRTLVLHLNRFSQGVISDGFGGSPFTGMRKNSTAVNVPPRLDMSPLCSPLGLAAARSVIGATPHYSLIAVSEHSGGMGGGHYTATTRCASNNLWYSFNDAHVSGPAKQPPCGPSSSAYVLFYKMSSPPKDRETPRR